MRIFSWRRWKINYQTGAQNCFINGSSQLFSFLQLYDSISFLLFTYSFFLLLLLFLLVYMCKRAIEEAILPAVGCSGLADSAEVRPATQPEVLRAVLTNQYGVFDCSVISALWVL